MGHKQLSAWGIFKVIYSPFKAFKEIVENPRYIGPILIMILYVVASVSSTYVAVSKSYVEQTLPKSSQLDEWTENKTLWMSNANITESADYITGTYYGNRSIEFSTINKTQIWMQLNTTSSINCSGIEGYKNISFRIKLIHPDKTKLENASLLLYSSSADYFYYNLTKRLTPLNTTIWNNLSIPIGPEIENWQTGTTEADWGNITQLRFEFTWLESLNATVRLDALLFRGIFSSELEHITNHILNSSLYAFMQFTIRWVILSGILYLLIKVLGSKTVWKPLLIVVGFSLITLFIQAVVNTATYATLPRMYYPLEFFSGIKGEFEIAYAEVFEATWLVYQIGNFVQIAIFIWTIALCAIALRLLTEFSWAKAIPVSTAAFFVSVLAEAFLLAY